MINVPGIILSCILGVLLVVYFFFMKYVQKDIFIFVLFVLEVISIFFVFFCTDYSNCEEYETLKDQYTRPILEISPERKQCMMENVSVANHLESVRQNVVGRNGRNLKYVTEWKTFREWLEWKCRTAPQQISKLQKLNTIKSLVLKTIMSKSLTSLSTLNFEDILLKPEINNIPVKNFLIREFVSIYLKMVNYRI